MTNDIYNLYICLPSVLQHREQTCRLQISFVIYKIRWGPSTYAFKVFFIIDTIQLIIRAFLTLQIILSAVSLPVLSNLLKVLIISSSSLAKFHENRLNYIKLTLKIHLVNNLILLFAGCYLHGRAHYGVVQSRSKNSHLSSRGILIIHCVVIQAYIIKIITTLETLNFAK